MGVYEKLEAMGLRLPDKPEGGGLYAQIKRSGDLVFVAKKKGVWVAASSVHRGLSRKCLQEKLGAFCPQEKLER